MKTKLLMFCLTFVGWVTYAQHDHAGQSNDKESRSKAMFNDTKLGTAYEQYLHVKDALVASQSDEAKKGAADLQKALKEVKGSTAALDAAAKIATSKDLTEQRTMFSILSNEMAKIVKGGKLSMGSVYLDYCPMANNNTGAYWLSNEKEIKNPYFGDAMLTCGGVKETIK